MDPKETKVLSYGGITFNKLSLVLTIEKASVSTQKWCKNLTFPKNLVHVLSFSCLRSVSKSPPPLLPS